jgi:DNA-binding NarL/FixJ family response regulator
VLIVAAQMLFREGLQALVRQDARFTVVGLAGSADCAMSEALRSKPDIVLLDLSLPDCRGIELIRRIRTRLPHSRIIVVSPDARPERISSAVEAGVAGYLRRDSRGERLMQCLDVVRGGGFCVDAHTLLDLVHGGNAAVSRPRSAADPPNGKGALTAREKQILHGVANGMTLKEIASELHLSLKTVGNHRSRVVGKLGLNTAVDIVRYAARIGLIDLEEWKEGS